MPKLCFPTLSYADVYRKQSLKEEKEIVGLQTLSISVQLCFLPWIYWIFSPFNLCRLPERMSLEIISKCKTSKEKSWEENMTHFVCVKQLERRAFVHCGGKDGNLSFLSR